MEQQPHKWYSKLQNAEVKNKLLLYCTMLHFYLRHVTTQTLIQSLTRNVLDCDQSNYSSRIIFSYTFPRTKYELDRMNRFRDMAIQNYTRRLTAAILDLVQPEVAPFDPPTSKTLP